MFWGCLMGYRSTMGKILMGKVYLLGFDKQNMIQPATTMLWGYNDMMCLKFWEFMNRRGHLLIGIMMMLMMMMMVMMMMNPWI